MPAYGFLSQFVDPMFAGRKPHTMRAVRKDKVPPRLGQPFHAYCGMRTLHCTWLFSSTIVKVDSVQVGPKIEHGVPWVRIRTAEMFRERNVPVLALDKTLTLIMDDGFRLGTGEPDIEGFRRHFCPEPRSRFIGHLIHWNPEDARNTVHSCRSCGERMRYSISCRAFVCVCTGIEILHRFKRRTKP